MMNQSKFNALVVDALEGLKVDVSELRKVALQLHDARNRGEKVDEPARTRRGAPVEPAYSGREGRPHTHPTAERDEAVAPPPEAVSLPSSVSPKHDTPAHPSRDTPAPSVIGSAQPKAGQSTRQKYEAMQTDQLREEARSSGISSLGSRQEMIDALVAKHGR